MNNSILRNAVIAVGTLIAAVLLLRAVGYFGHSVANTASALHEKV